METQKKIKTKKKKTLKLFVWEGVLNYYTSGVAFALAYDVEGAKKQLLKSGLYQSAIDEELKDKPQIIKSPKGFYQYGGG